MRSPIQTRPEDLPPELPVFPLSGALLLPWGRLPLNIFEPRYLHMTLDALKAGRIFGMIQPNYDKEAKAEKLAADGATAAKADPALYDVGCAGRISSFEETEDGRLIIVLRGLIRFRVAEELEARSGYRRVRADYSTFKADLDGPPKLELERKTFLESLQPYLEAHAMPVNVEVLKGLSDANLVTSLCMICPFDPREKQALLETPTLTERTSALLTLLQMGVFEARAADAPRQ